MQFVVEKPVGPHPKGVTVTEKDFTAGRAEELVRAGVLTPTDGRHAVPTDPSDLEGWKRRAKALEADNKALRTSEGGPEQLAKINDLEGTCNNLLAENDKLRTVNLSLSEQSVPKGVFENLHDQHEQLKRLHETTVTEFEKLKAEKSGEAKDKPEPDKKEK